MSIPLAGGGQAQIPCTLGADPTTAACGQTLTTTAPPAGPLVGAPLAGELVTVQVGGGTVALDDLWGHDARRIPEHLRAAA